MRVISGLRRGLKLNAPQGVHTRPTTDRVKESVFNIIQFSFPAERVLDLFAGSGALGIEALSRGAKHCVFVDADMAAFRLVKENLRLARFEEQATVLNQQAERFLSSCNEGFDVIFLDPPYNQGFLKPILDTIVEKSLLNEDGILVIETELGGEEIPPTPFSVKKSVAYGKTVITILKR
ncbi:MAG: 16S rRNA (guanine(966)-N(2))-methyltransferase RsmD [Clostridia bacterium]|nr:16S rRNA (guanine(966)-N(2))-methyltransferase RsmD [Clostridia bacterium]